MAKLSFSNLHFLTWWSWISIHLRPIYTMLRGRAGGRGDPTSSSHTQFIAWTKTRRFQQAVVNPWHIQRREEAEEEIEFENPCRRSERNIRVWSKDRLQSIPLVVHVHRGLNSVVASLIPLNSFDIRFIALNKPTNKLKWRNNNNKANTILFVHFILSSLRLNNLLPSTRRRCPPATSNNRPSPTPQSATTTMIIVRQKRRPKSVIYLFMWR